MPAPLAPPVPAGLDRRVLDSVTSALPPGGITFLVEGAAITYDVHGSEIRVREGADDGAAAVRLSRPAWDDMVGQVRTFIGLFLAQELTFERGAFQAMADWDPVLKYLHAGIPPYHPERADLEGRDPAASFPADCDDQELAAQLRAMGYLHVRGVFTPGEMAAAGAEIDRLAAEARPGDDRSWWVTAQDGSSQLCRLVYATLRSPVLAALEGDPRVRRLGTLLDPDLKVAPDRMEGTAVLLKVPGETKGLSNIPWHQDCGVGGHAILCPALSVGIQVSGSDAATGHLLVVPGSHGQTLHYQWPDRMQGVPVTAVDTAPGDVTVHVADVMHASPPPAGQGGRRTMYVTFYPPRLWDHFAPGEAFNDLVRNRTEQVARLQ
ncbi:MAG TPA: phytanoyl-CoA dioxygenase family protein [Acidimicrobiales bacterium]|nr:phytanoyl-CoA dioxygenase family protein [Acidimicrobiales bacterium]